MIFYIFTIMIIGLNVPWDYPKLSNRSTTTSPFTIVFKLAGSSAAASIMNTVILTSVLSAGNHALFAGTRVLYGLSVTTPRQAPKLFSWTTSAGTPIPALLMTSSISALCFCSSFIGSGELWGWLQNIVGVSNQIAWLSIALSSWRFRKAWIRQGRSLEELKFRAAWTWPWGPPFVVIAVTILIMIQGWSSFIPTFSLLDFMSFYIEIPIIVIMFAARMIWKRPCYPKYGSSEDPSTTDQLLPRSNTHTNDNTRSRFHDLVDVDTIDLFADEYAEEGRSESDAEDEAKKRKTGRMKLLWLLYYWLV